MNTTTQAHTPMNDIAQSLGRLQASGAALLQGLLGQPAVESETVYLRRMDRGGTHWISRPQGRRVTCDSGVLWLCFDGEATDVTLEPGQSHTCESQARLSVYALQTSSFHVV